MPEAETSVAPGKAPVKIEDGLIRPNGVQLSKDEKTLYVDDSNEDRIIAWNIRPTPYDSR